MTLNVRLIDKGGYYMKGFKKLAAGFLGVVMALSVCSFTAFAAGNVAKIGDKEYENFATAVEEANSGDIIVLLDDVTTNSFIDATSEGYSITLDLNGHDFEYEGVYNEEGKYYYSIGALNGGNVTVTDNSVSGTRRGGTFTISNDLSLVSVNGSSLTLKNINIDGKGTVLTYGDSSVTMENCDMYTNNYYGISTNANSEDNYDVDINIINSTITCDRGDQDGDCTAVMLNVRGSLNIEDSELTADRQALIARAGNVTLKNSRLTVTGKYAEKEDGNATEYHKGSWGSGNEVPTGALVVGNKTENSYNAKAEVTIENCVITSEKSNVPAIFTEANKLFKSSVEISGEDTVVDGAVKKGENKDDTTVKIIDGKFTDDYENIKDYIDTDSEYITDKDGNIIIMGEEAYEDYLDSKRPSHSYSLSEKKPEDRDDDEEEEPVVTPEPEEEEGPFSDVGKDNPNYDAIVEVYEKGWMAGIGDGVFAPNGTLTRGMAVTILWNRAGQPEPVNVAPFLDVTSDAWYAKAVAWAYENGITSGYGDTYGPDDFITTEQFTRMNDIADGRTPEVYVGGAPYATRGWVAGLLVME